MKFSGRLISNDSVAFGDEPRHQTQEIDSLTIPNAEPGFHSNAVELPIAGHIAELSRIQDADDL